jgi:hypothetical protein
MVVHLCAVGGRRGAAEPGTPWKRPNCLITQWTAYSSTYTSNTNRRLVIQYTWSREHRDESPCGARATTMAGAYDVHRTWASTIRLI